MAGLLSAGLATAQSVSFPPSITLPNYNRVPIGMMSSLEGGAFVARTDDSSAHWFNPAGLGRSEASDLSANATLFESTDVTADGLGESGKTRTFRSVPAFLGTVMKLSFLGNSFYGGFSVTQPLSWTQAIDTDLLVERSGQRESFIYGADTSFSRLVPGVALAFAPKGPLRLGLGVSLDITDLRSTLDVSDRLEGTGGPRSTLVTVRGKGSVTHARLIFGGQYDLDPALRIGAVIRTPGLRISRSGSLTVESVATGPAGTLDVLFRDQSADFDYKLPLEVWIGASYKLGRAELELDLKGYDRVGSYQIFGSNEMTRILTTEGAGSPPVVTTEPFQPVMNRARRVVNVAAGARLPMKKGMLAHLGFFTDLSPAQGSTGETFQKVDLYGLTLGGSRPGEHFTSSFGLVFVFGSSSTIPVSDLATGGQVSTQIKVRSVGFVYGSAYRF